MPNSNVPFLQESNRMVIEGEVVDVQRPDRFSYRVGDDRKQPEDEMLLN